MDNVEVVLLDSRIEGLLAYGSERAAGIDLRACNVEFKGHSRILNADEEHFPLYPGESVLVGTGFAMHIGSLPGADDLEAAVLAGLVIPRSGLGTKHRIRLSNTIGLIDDDYQGEIKLAVENGGTNVFHINALDRLAQLVIVPVIRAGSSVVTTFSNTTKRGAGGFGSTGKQ